MMSIKACIAAATAAALAACGANEAEPPMSGYAEAELVYVAAPTAGVLQTLAVRRGDRVVRGQALFALDTRSEVLGRDAAAARSESADAQARNLRKGARPLELLVVQQQLAQAQATLTASAATLQRNQRLVEQGFIAAVRLDELVAARDRDAARVRELQAQRASAAEAARIDEIAAAAAQADATRADAAQARWREDERSRESPADAMVFDVMFRTGEWVNAGVPVLALLPPGAVKVRFFVPQTVLAQTTVGREIRLSCDGCPAGLAARITHVSPQAEYTPPLIYSNVSRSKLVFMVEAQPADAAALKPGQPLDVRFASPSQ
jgi:HlyD family secretion protein